MCHVPRHISGRSRSDLGDLQQSLLGKRCGKKQSSPILWHSKFVFCILATRGIRSAYDFYFAYGISAHFLLKFASRSISIDHFYVRVYIGRMDYGEQDKTD